MFLSHSGVGGLASEESSSFLLLEGPSGVRERLLRLSGFLLDFALFFAGALAFGPDLDLGAGLGLGLGPGLAFGFAGVGAGAFLRGAMFELNPWDGGVSEIC